MPKNPGKEVSGRAATEVERDGLRLSYDDFLASFHTEQSFAEYVDLCRQMRSKQWENLSVEFERETNKDAGDLSVQKKNEKPNYSHIDHFKQILYRKLVAVRLRKLGVANADGTLRTLISQRSPILFSKSESDDIDYDAVFSEDVLPMLLELEEPALAFKRLNRLGYEPLWRYELSSVDILAPILNRLSSIPEKQFEKYLQTIFEYSDLYTNSGVIRPVNSPSSDGNTQYELAPSLVAVVDILASEGISTDQQEFLRIAKVHSHVFGKKFTARPFDWYVENPSFLFGLSVMVSEFQERWMSLTPDGKLINTKFFQNAILLYEMGKLDPLVYAINSYGFTVDFSFVNTMFWSDLSSPATKSESEEIEEVIGEIDKTDLVFSGEDTDEEVAQEIYYLSNYCEESYSIRTSERLASINSALAMLYGRLESISEERIISSIRTLINDDFSKFLTMLLGEDYDRSEYQLVVLAFKDNPWYLKKFLKDYVLTHIKSDVFWHIVQLNLDCPFEMLPSNFEIIMTRISEEERILLEVAMKSGRAKKILKFYKYCEAKIGTLIAEGKLNSTFIKEITLYLGIEEFTELVRGQFLDEYLDQSELSNCRYVVLARMPAELALFLSKENPESLFDEFIDEHFNDDGLPNAEFYKYVFLLSRDKNHQFSKIEITYFTDGLTSFNFELLPEEMRGFWTYFRHKSEGGVAVLLELLRFTPDIDKSYFINNFPTEKFYISLLILIKKYLGRANLEYFIEEDDLVNIPQEFKDVWKLVLKNVNSFPDNIINGIIEDVSGIEKLRNLLNQSDGLLSLIQSQPSLANVLIRDIYKREDSGVSIGEVAKKLVDRFPDYVIAIRDFLAQLHELDNVQSFEEKTQFILSDDFDFLINKILIATDTHSSQNKVLIAHFTMISNIRTKDVVAFVQYIRETQDKIDWQEFVFTVGQTFPTLRRFVEAISLPDFIQYAEDPLLANQSDKNKALSYAIEVFLDARTDLNFALAFLEERSQQIGVIPSAVMLPFLPRIAFTYWRKQGKVESILDYLELKMDKYELVAPQITEMPDFCQMIFFDFPLSGLSDARFYQIVDDSVNVDTLTSNDREQLKDVVRGSGSVQAFLADKSKIKELIKKSSPMFAKQLLYSLLGTPFSNDSETFVMQDGSAQKRMELGLTCDIVFINGDASLSSEKMEELGFDLELVDRVQSGALLLSTIMRNSNEDPIEQLVNFFGDDEFSDGTAFSKFMDELSTELLDAPDTARAIAIRHRRLNRSRKVPSFKLVSYSKVMNAFYSELRSGMSPRAVNRVLETCLFLFLDLQKQFREVTEEIAPRIADFTRLVDEKFYGKGVWFSGRDGIPLFLAFKASHWGESLGTRESYKHILLKQIEQDAQRRSQIIQLAQKADKTTDDEFRQMTDERQSALFNRGFEIYLSGQIRLNELLKFFSISRLSTNDRMSESEKALQARLLKSSGITNSMIAADTGSSGTVISAAMNLVGGITREDMLLWGVGSDFDTTYQEIETLPKYSERTVFFDPEGQPFAFPTSPYQRMLAWATDQAVVRYFVPRETEFSTNAHELPPIQERVRKYGLDRDIEESAVEEALPIVTELHRFVYDNIAPTLVGFTDFVLRDVSQKDPPVKIVFAGRDGLVYFRAAKKLMSRFPERYTLTEDQLVYAFLTRKVISNNTSHEIQEYLAQLGISPEDKITLVDIGMYGTILDKLDQIEGIQIEDVEYLISRTSQANGYIDDETTKTTNLFSRLSGNPAVHFLEDTLSGEIQSPSRLIRNSAGQFIPDSYDKTYSFRERAMREFALQATEDYVDTLTTPSFDYDADKSRLLQALESTENFQHLMVPHER